MTSSTNIFVTNGILHFIDTSIYEQFLTEFNTSTETERIAWLGNFDFESLHSIGVTDEFDSLYEIRRTPLEYILNSDFMVCVGNRMCKLDIQNNDIYFSDSQHDTVITHLIDMIPVSNLVYSCKMANDVLYNEDLNDLDSVGDASYKSCHDKGANYKVKENCAGEGGCNYTSGETSYSVKCKSVYQGMGIWFRIQNKIRHRKQGQGLGSSPTDMCIATSGYPTQTGNHLVKPKCKSIIASSWSTQFNTNVSELSNISYSSGKALTGFNCYIFYTWKKPGTLYYGDYTVNLAYGL